MDIFSLILVVVGFAFIIFIHELGHFILSKIMGFKVEEFAVGFGKPLLSKKFGETLYSIRAIPLGGYNKLPEVDSSYVKEPMSLKYYLKRFSVLVAGGLFNIISAYIVIIMTVAFLGVPTSSPVIKEVSPETSQYAQLFKPQDEILSINGEKVTSGDFLKGLENTSLDIVVKRDDEEVLIHIEKEEKNQPVGIIMASVIQKPPVEEIIPMSNQAFFKAIGLIFTSFDILSKMPADDMVKNVAGPVGISQMMYQAQIEMGLVGFLTLFAIISINIGIMNLLPIPLMDGGRILVDTIQFASRNIIPEKGIQYIEYSGLLCIGLLFFLGMMGDFYRLVLVKLPN